MLRPLRARSLFLTHHGSAVCSVLLLVLALVAALAAQVTGANVPPPWANVDVGTITLPGAATLADGAFNIQAAGIDIWGTSDSFNYTTQPVGSDIQLTARIVSLENTNTFAKAGVMLRESLAPDAPHVILDVRPDGSLEFMTRATAGGPTTFIAGGHLAFPAWLRLAQSGSTVSAWSSADGTAWTLVGAVTSSGTLARAGLAVTSHAASTSTQAVIDDVSVSPSVVTPPVAPSMPSAPSPSADAVSIVPSPLLTWSAPGATSYDVALGTSNPPAIVAPGLPVRVFRASALAAATTYYWQVTARNQNGATAGQIWSFTTAERSSNTVDVWLTTPDMAHLLSQQSPLLLTPDTGGSTQTIDIDESVRFQPFDGVGAAMTDSSAWLLSSVVPSSVRGPLMTQLFDPFNGIGLSNLRLPIGASDFSLAQYSYDDVPAGQTDYSLSEFSTAHDQAYIIPMLQLARQINPNIHMIAAPWSPPAWMKTNGSLLAGSLKTDTATQSALANYFVRFLQDYAAAGVAVQRITPQNEPLLQDGTYPTMLMDVGTESSFITSYLAPAVAAAHLPTEILAYDQNWDNTTYPLSVLAGPAGGVVSGTAFHCYAGRPDAMTLVHDQFPAKDIHFSECSADTFTSGFLRNLRFDMQTLIVGAIRNWARTILKWNLILDTAHGPHIGGCPNCLGLLTVDRTTSPPTILYNYDFYTMGHVGRFVRPGAFRVSSNTFGTDNIEDVALTNPDGTTVVIVVNTDTSARPFKIRRIGSSVSYTLPPGAAATFVLPPAASAATVPAPWTTGDVGAVATPGTAVFSGDSVTVAGSGADIWGSADAFRFVSQPVSGDVQVVARVTSLQDTSAFAKAGIMLRGSTAAAAAHVILDVKPDGAVEFMQRPVENGETTYLGGTGVGLPAWLRLVRTGATVAASVSNNGAQWTTIGSTTATFGTPLLAGLAVSSHATAAATAVFDHVEVAPVTSIVSPPSGPVPATGSTGTEPGLTLTWTGSAATYSIALGTTNPPPVIATGLSAPAFTAAVLTPGTTYYWQVSAQGGSGSASGPVWSFSTKPADGRQPSTWIDQDIGSVGASGSSTFGSASITINAAGNDIWGTADSFHYVAQPATGDVQITTRVTRLQNTNAFAKAGVMLRDSTSAGSPHVILDIKPDGSVEFMQRSATGGSTTFLRGATVGYPAWLRLTRVGALVTAAISADGATWVTVGTTSQTASPTGLAGYAVASHTAALTTAAFDTQPQ